MHKAGYVNIFGRPNVGKSTLLNALLNDQLVVATPKPQTTRHRILGILNTDEAQIVFSDTPGFIDEPAYKMQKAMKRYALSVKKDADVLIYLAELSDEPDEHIPLIYRIREEDVPLLVVLNKKDLLSREEQDEHAEQWSGILKKDEIFVISALLGEGTDELLNRIFELLPEHPPYFPKDQMSDRSIRFFIGEIIRKHILMQFHEEVPYSAEVVVTDYKDDDEANPPIVRIRADIYVMRNSQKGIIIGKGGKAIKKLGTAARKEIETFLDKKVYLELQVKTKKNWRDDPGALSRFGYDQ